jgi:hypothetical protein
MQQEQPSRVGRRLAAIVAADVAGYSRLVGLDEVGTARTANTARSPMHSWRNTGDDEGMRLAAVPEGGVRARTDHQWSRLRYRKPNVSDASLSQ